MNDGTQKWWERHILHEALDCVIDEYLQEHPDRRASNTTLRQVLTWYAARGLPMKAN